MDRFRELDSAESVYRDVRRVLRATGLPGRQVILRLSNIESDVPDERIRAAFRAGRDWLANGTGGNDTMEDN